MKGIERYGWSALSLRNRLRAGHSVPRSLGPTSPTPAPGGAHALAPQKHTIGEESEKLYLVHCGNNTVAASVSREAGSTDEAAASGGVWRGDGVAAAPTL